MRTTRTLLILISFGLLCLTVTGAVLGEPEKSNTYKYLSNFADTMEYIETAYVEPQDLDVVMQGAFSGLLDALDPESAYLTPEEGKALDKSLKADGWLGLEISKRYGRAVVLSVYKAGPAGKAGLRTGDVLRSVNNRSTRRSSLPTVRAALLGKVGDSVQIKLISAKSQDERELTLKLVAPPRSFEIASVVPYPGVERAILLFDQQAFPSFRSLGFDRFIRRQIALEHLHQHTPLAEVENLGAALAGIQGEGGREDIGCGAQTRHEAVGSTLHARRSLEGQAFFACCVFQAAARFDGRNQSCALFVREYPRPFEDQRFSSQHQPLRFEGRRFRRDLLVDSKEVKSIGRPDDVRDVARFHGEGGVVEGGVIVTAGEESEVTALFGGGQIL